MGGPKAPLSPQKSVTAMRGLIDTFGPNQSGKSYNYDGREYPCGSRLAIWKAW
jgi:hypothetical protein